jgi:sugar-specific transcriptional regulator TrmB
MFDKIFEELNISDNSRRVFKDLLESGSSSARKISERLDIPRPSVYDHLKVLIEKGLVTERYADNKKYFFIDNPENILQLIQEKINYLNKEKETFREILPSLMKNINHTEPKVKFYSGSDGLKQIMNQIMLNHDIDTILMWPMSEMMKVLGKEYLEELNARRIEKNISIRGIWPQDKKLKLKDYPFLGVGKKHLRDLRIAPEDMTWNMGYWMFKDKVGFLSSSREMFGFIIESKDFTELLKTQFEAMWQISTPLKPEPQNTNVFIEKIKNRK